MTIHLIFYALLFLLSALLILSAVSWRSNLPPGPLALPIIGHFHLLGPHIHKSFHKLSLRYGPLISLKLGSVACVVASTPETAKLFLKHHDLTFSSRQTSLAIDHLTYNSGLAFALYGPYWKFMRKLSVNELLGGRTLKQLLPIREKEYHRFLKVVLDKAEVGESVNVTQEMLKMTNNIISRLMVSMRCSETDNQAEEARTVVREVTQIFGEFNVSDFIWFFRKWDLQGFRKRFENIHRRYDALLERLITNKERERMERKIGGGDEDGGEKKVKDLLDIMLDFLEDESSEMRLTRNHIKALILDFFTAGTDTTAITAEWALAELINHPNLLQKSRDEITAVVGNSRLVEESDGPNLLYIQAIIKETFRLHPPIPMLTRKSIQQCTIGKYTIPENTSLFVNLWSIGRDPNYWDAPSEFIPERFMESNLDFRGNHFELLPFGSGRRVCPGISMAAQELQAILAAMIQCFDWKVEENGGVVDMSERPGLSAPRANDLICFPVAKFDLHNIIHA